MYILKRRMFTPSPRLLAAIKWAKENETVAEVDCGGGNCGRWSFGAKTALYDMGIFPAISMGAGTSVGALNILLSGLYGDDWDKAMSAWCNVEKNSDIYNGSLNNNIFGWIGQVIKDNKMKYVLYPEGLYKLFDAYFGKYNLRDTSVKTIITTTNLETLERVEYLSWRDDISCVLAAIRSSAMNGIFPMNEDKDGQYVDGGWGNNTPVMSAIAHGATKVILMATTPNAKIKRRIKNSIIDIAGRSVESAMWTFEELMWKEYEEHQSKPGSPTVEKLEIIPDKDTGLSTNFANVDIMQDGYDWVCENITEEDLINFLLA